MSNSPHYLLFSEASSTPATGRTWRFVLLNVATNERLVVSDSEATDRGERLELLAVVRGLEALDGPARVTLVTKSRYVSRGLKYALPDWRAGDWHWERFGRLTPIKDADLWQRVDRALLFHEVDCQTWQFEDAAAPEQDTAEASQVAAIRLRRDAPHRLNSLAPRAAAVTREPRQKSATNRIPVLHRVRGAVVERVNQWGETLRELAAPPRQAIQGAT
jgi:ribonuclease HI